MAQVELTRVAVEDSDRLIALLSLPANARDRVRASLRALDEFSRLGTQLTGRWEGLRFIVGPWRWMLLVYEYYEAENRVVVLTIRDAMSSNPVTHP